MDGEERIYASQQYKQFYYYFLDYAFHKLGDREKAEFIMNEAVYEVVKEGNSRLDNKEFVSRVIYKLNDKLEGRK